jgi:2-oxoglutarate ferredoxin oxidoreductase subunit alpha
MVAMNPQTWDRDIAEIEPGGYLFYDSTKALPARVSATTSRCSAFR